MANADKTIEAAIRTYYGSPIIPPAREEPGTQSDFEHISEDAVNCIKKAEDIFNRRGIPHFVGTPSPMNSFTQGLQSEGETKTTPQKSA